MRGGAKALLFRKKSNIHDYVCIQTKSTFKIDENNPQMRLDCVRVFLEGAQVKSFAGAASKAIKEDSPGLEPFQDIWMLSCWEKEGARTSCWPEWKAIS